jgi:two-component system cell cycle response regulator
MRILVAEDDAISRTLLERTLQRAGYAVISVENGAQAIAELIKPDAPRLALLDWIMPEMDGVEVCREIRRRKEQAYTYLILLSSKESKGDIVAGLESGADDYLTKPFNVDELKARLRTGHRILELEDHLVEARESMRFQATHDLLTSLWNRGVIVELMSHEIMRSRRERSCTAVMMCDIDHFKSVNDQFGHAVGDEVLREVARRLHNSVRSYDMVGRYGGEEFLVALNKCNPGSAVSRAENLREKIASRPIQTADKPVSVTISIGLALSSEFAQSTLEEIMHQADMALYAAKAAGRNCVRVAKPSGGGNPTEEQPTESQVLMP